MSIQHWEPVTLPISEVSTFQIPSDMPPTLPVEKLTHLQDPIQRFGIRHSELPLIRIREDGRVHSTTKCNNSAGRFPVGLDR